jgi:hypothetical protein
MEKVIDDGDVLTCRTLGPDMTGLLAYCKLAFSVKKLPNQ